MSIGRKSAGAPSWMVTFADMMSLLLALFVLMLSFSTMDAERYRQIAGSMRDAFGAQRFLRMAGTIELGGNPVREFARDVSPAPLATTAAVEPPLPPGPERNGVLPPEPVLPVPSTLAKLKHRLADDLIHSMVSVDQWESRIVVSFPDSVAFPPASAELADSFRPVLDRLAAVLEETEGEIVVAGHTDSTPIVAGRFRSNWDLSAARAVSVIHYWLEHSSLSPARLTAEGHADSRPRFVGDSPQDRIANRRVEISIRMR